MSRRDLSQPSFVDAMVSGYGKVGGFLDRIEKAFDWSSFEALLSPIHGSATGAPGYPPLTMFKILLLQQWHTLFDPARRRGCGAGPAVVPPLLRPAAGDRDAGSRLDLALSPSDRQAWPVDEAVGGGQPPARRARPDPPIKRGTLVDPRPSSPGRSGALMRAAGSIRATPRLVSRASATRPISVIRRIWRWTRRAGLCARPR